MAASPVLVQSALPPPEVPPPEVPPPDVSPPDVPPPEVPPGVVPTIVPPAMVPVKLLLSMVPLPQPASSAATSPASISRGRVGWAIDVCLFSLTSISFHVSNCGFSRRSTAQARCVLWNHNGAARMNQGECQILLFASESQRFNVGPKIGRHKNFLPSMSNCQGLRLASNSERDIIASLTRRKRRPARAPSLLGNYEEESRTCNF